MEWLGRKPSWLGERRSELSPGCRSQDLYSRVKEGDGPVNSTQISWFTRFGNWRCNCVFPNGGNIAVVDSEVVKMSEVLKS